MILLDTHIWVWWVNNSDQLSEKQRNWIEKSTSSGLGVSIISIWEVAKLVENKRLILSLPVDKWIGTALEYPGIQKINLVTEIIIKSTQLEGKFHKDPADQLIVATSIIMDIPILTGDKKLLKYPYVKLCR